MEWINAKCVCVVCVCMRARQFNQVARDIGLVIESKGSRFNSRLCQFVSLSKKIYLVYPWPAVYWGPGGLVSSGEAAHPAVTSMGAWESQSPTALVSFSSVGTDLSP